MRVLGQHDGRKRAKALAELHLSIDDFLHVRVPGIAEDTAAAQRPRPELHPALVPADHLALPDGGGNLPAQRLLVIHPPVDRGHGPEEFLDPWVAVLRADQ